MSFIDTQDGLFEGFSNLNLDSSDADSVKPASQASSSVKKRKKRARALRAKGGGTPVGATPIPAQTPANVTGPKKKAKKAAPAVATTKAKSKKRSKPKSAPSAVPSTGGEDGLGERPIVDDVSEAGDSRVYEDAVQYVSTFLSSPSEKAKGSGNLTLLQALIIELGLLPTSSSTTSSSFYNLPSLPRSLTAAKALLKSRVFLNVRDYLDVRHKGLEALRNVMHPSRKALVKDLTREKGRRRVPRDLIKNSGLGVLLVTCW
ncbi:hypothetical protein EW026_g1035 [Hermanssonia centrifuga]|uniref:Uncharacterized protein n=1 Tax=Hermanssonia centrifuga TaxID=98765 RepID=A0A4S4KSR9_9APHY|nr:hypothetical protein EW026_g1035 [Hermanssonia centrifuga]